MPLNYAKTLINNNQNPGHIYKFKNPSRTEIFGSKNRTCPGKTGHTVALICSCIVLVVFLIKFSY